MARRKRRNGHIPATARGTSFLQQLANGCKIIATDYKVIVKHPDDEFGREIVWSVLQDYLLRGWISKESEQAGVRTYSLTSSGWSAVAKEKQQQEG